MHIVRDAMSQELRFVSPDSTVSEAAREMAERDVGALPVCDADRRLHGMITDRDITTRVVARGLDPSRTLVRDVVGDGDVVYVGADDEIDTAVEMMKRHAVRRVPVMDGSRVIGVLAQADIAERAEAEAVGALVRTISEAPADGHPERA